MQIDFAKIHTLTFILIILVFSDGIRNFKENFILIKNSNDFKIRTSNTFSRTENYSKILKIVKSCKGLMTYDTRFFGGFTDYDLNKLYNTWEIPPFGSLNDSNYVGLNPKRVDCIATPYIVDQKTDPRYKNFLNPYKELLVEMGANVYYIHKYGEITVLNKNLL